MKRGARRRGRERLHRGVTTSNDIDEPAIPPGDGGLVRLRLDLGYDGTDFSGWARQPGLRTVQETVETRSPRCCASPRRRRSPSRDGPTPACTRRARSRTSTSPTHRPRSGWPDGSTACCRDDVRGHSSSASRHLASTRGSRRLGRRYRYRVTDGPPDPLRRRDTVCLAAPARRRRDATAAQGAGRATTTSRRTAAAERARRRFERCTR